MEDLLPPSWKSILTDECSKPYFLKLTTLVQTAYRNHTIFPQSESIFNALSLCPFENVRVVILGQDPYHGQHQAHGLCFSVQTGVKIPPSLKNIYKEIQNDIGNPIPSSGNLAHWAEQGVLLLNSSLTVEESKPGSHQKFGWEHFTDTIIKTISNDKERVVFLLWGNFARSKASLIDSTRHLILEAPHPSPLSAYTGFFGCKHFSQTNDYLTDHQHTPIKW